MQTAATELGLIAQSQYGVFARAHALHAGFSARMISRNVADGRWRSLAPGVYCDVCLPISWEVRAMAAVLSIGAGGAVSHFAAARLWGLADFDRYDRVDVTSPRRRGSRKFGWHEATDLCEADVTRMGALAVTTVTRTLRDLRLRVPKRKLLMAAGDGMRKGLTDATRILEEAARLRDGPGSRVLKDIAASLDPELHNAASPMEVHGITLLRELGFNGFKANFPHRLTSGRKVVFDAARPDIWLAFEWDSRRHHSSEADLAADTDRDHDVLADDWTFRRFRWSQLKDRARFKRTVQSAITSAKKRAAESGRAPASRAD